MDPFIDFTALRRPPSPNTALIAPAGVTPLARPDAAPPVFDESPGALFARLDRLVRAERGWREVQADPAGLRLRFVAVTPLFRFRDDVDIAVLPVSGAPERATLAAYSRSRVGYSDVGTNRRRLDRLIAALATP